MQKMPCDVRAYRRFSIFLLQFRHRKHPEQKAWSPVKIARSSILLLHALQLYVQLLQMRLPSPSSSRLASESRRVPHVLHRKQSMCHRLPASSNALPSSSISPQPLHGYTTSSCSIGDSGYVLGDSIVAIVTAVGSARAMGHAMPERRRLRMSPLGCSRSSVSRH